MPMPHLGGFGEGEFAGVDALQAPQGLGELQSPPEPRRTITSMQRS